MSDLPVSPDELDRWLADQHRELLDDLAATLDVEAGLSDALLRTRYRDFVADLDRSLDVETGLAAITRAAPSDEPPMPNRVSTLTGLRKRLRGRARALVVAAGVAIGLVVTIPTVISQNLAAPPPPELDILAWGISPPSGDGVVPCGPGEPVKFTFTVVARGSGTVHYVWLPNKDLSNLPIHDDSITFTGPERTENVDYTAPCNTGAAQQLGMRVALISEGVFQGASSLNYDCRPPMPAAPMTAPDQVSSDCSVSSSER